MFMIRQAIISSGVIYHQYLTQPGQPLADFEVLDLADLARIDLNVYGVVLVPRSTDGDILRARRYQFARYLDQGGVLLAFGELWANWFPGCNWQAECAADIQEPVIVGDNPLLAGFSARALHWHPVNERWCCHGHLQAPPGVEVLVQNARGDAWLYIDRATTNGVILASSNLDPDTHTYHGHEIAKILLERMITWAQDEATEIKNRRGQQIKKIAGLYSGVHFQKMFYQDAEFGPHFAILPGWELASVNLYDFSALWIPRESNQNELLKNRKKLVNYLHAGGTLICFDEISQPWLPAGQWSQRPANLEQIRIANHPLVAQLRPHQVRWHSHGTYATYPNVDILLDDQRGGVLLFLDEKTFSGRLLAGTLDPDCHAGYGSEITRPLLRAILAWLRQPETEPVEVAVAV